MSVSPTLSAREWALHPDRKGVLVGLALFLAIFAVASLLVPGFASTNNLRSILVLAAFLGIAALGQTMVALVGTLDLSIPFVIGAANILLAFLIASGLPTPVAIVLIAAMGAGIGALNGLLGYRIQGQALIVTLGVGFVTVGVAQIITTIGSQYSGSVFAQVPAWFSTIASVNGRTFGLHVPPVLFLWAALTLAVTWTMRRTVAGREIYAIGDNRTAASRLSISEFGVWMRVHAASGLMASVAGMLLLGFSGGGFVGVGDPYLFTTVAAVVVGGTSLLGGAGGYGATVVGVLVLQTLTSFLVGMGFSYAAQQTVFGLLILPMVALYARAPHIRLQI
jgi:ribose transport system permease protein